MPQFVAPFTIKDGSATPADVTYGPEKLSSSESLLVDRRLPSRDQNPTIKINFETPIPQRRSYKHVTEAILPIVRTVGGVDTVMRPGRANLKFDLPENMTEQERKHLFAMIINGVQQAFVKAGVTGLDPLY